MTHGQKFELREISPAQAQEWLLKANTHNRSISKTTVARYAAAMAAGEWRSPMAEPITFDRNGVLQEGQHRLAALVMAGMTLPMWVATGADPDDFEAIGSGRVRRIGDVLGMKGVPDPSTVAAAARIAVSYRRSPHLVWGGKVHDAITRGEIDAEGSRPEYGVAVRRAAWMQKRLRRLNRATATSFIVLAGDLSAEDEDTVATFCDLLANGDGLRRGDPCLTLRDWWSNGTGEGGSWPAQRRLAVTIRAWNAWVGGEQLKQLKFVPAFLPMPPVK